MFSLRSARILILAAMTITAVSCSKDPLPEQVVQPQPQSKTLLHIIEQDPFNYVSLDYTTDSLVQKFKMQIDTYSQEVTYVYGANKKPVQALFDGLKANYTYNGGTLDKVEYINAGNPNNTVLSYVKFDYLGTNPMLARVYSKQGNSYVEITEIVYEYYNNGDLKTMTTLDRTAPDHFEMSEFVTYEYDTKPNPLKISDEALLILFLNNPKHNITKERHYDSQARLVETNTYTYQYDTAGYPVKGVETSEYATGPASTRNITYKYK